MSLEHRKLLTIVTEAALEHEPRPIRAIRTSARAGAGARRRCQPPAAWR